MMMMMMVGFASFWFKGISTIDCFSMSNPFYLHMY